MTASYPQKKLASLSNRASKVISSGTQTYSRHSCRYVQGVYPDYISHGYGAMLYDLDNRGYIDYVCSLGTNLLGYAHPKVNEAVRHQIEQGVLFSLPHPKEILLAEKIRSMIPSMEMMRFLKSGSEAVSAGIKIARSYTGRDMVLSNGYHGWHDWSTPITDQFDGTPKSCGESILPFEYNDLDDLENKLRYNEVACVVLDPFIFDAPAPDYLDKLIKLSHKFGALVLFDEVVTGIRWAGYAVQNAYKVKPDLTALGKGLANGFAISCIGGKCSIMKVLDEGCFVSSTYGGDLVGISAALATLDIVESEEVPLKLEESGEMLIDGLRHIGIEMNCSPFRQRMTFQTPEHRALFWQECMVRGVMFGGAQHTSLAHSIPLVIRTLDIAEEAMKVCRLYADNPMKGMKGKLPKPVSTISNLRKKNG